MISLPHLWGFYFPIAAHVRISPHCRYRNVLVPDSISNRNTPATSREWTLIFYHIKSQQAYHFREIKQKNNWIFFTALTKILPSTFESKGKIFLTWENCLLLLFSSYCIHFWTIISNIFWCLEHILFPLMMSIISFFSFLWCIRFICVSGSRFSDICVLGGPGQLFHSGIWLDRAH